MCLETEETNAQEGDAEIAIDWYLARVMVGIWVFGRAVRTVQIRIKERYPHEVLQSYEYAKHWVLHPPLKEREVGYICKTLGAVCNSCNFTN